MYNIPTLTDGEDPDSRCRAEQHVPEEKREGTQESQEPVPHVAGVGECWHHHKGACGESNTTLRHSSISTQA